MPRLVTGGIIQAAAPITDPAAPIEKVRQAAIDAHIPLIEEAGRKGVQILGLQDFLAMESEDKDELVVADMDLDMIEDVRRTWQFYRDRRPETYAPMAEQLP